MAKRKSITGNCLPWKDVLGFLGTLPPWQELCEQVESRCTILTEDTRRIMAASIGVCSHNYSFPENLHKLFKMANSGSAEPFRWHGQVSPKRWLAVNTAIVAIQGWLEGKSAVSLSRTFGLRQKDLNNFMTLMGHDRSRVKQLMLKRLLWNIIDNAVHNTGLGIIADCDHVPAEEVTYADFTEAYRWDADRFYFELRPEHRLIRELDEELQRCGPSGSAFVSYIKTPTPPFCQQKMLRYQQVALYRIAGKWEDPTARPPGGVRRSEYEALFNIYTDAVSRWYENLRLPAAGGKREVYEKVFALLGERTECKRAVIDCLVFRSKPAQDIQEAAYHWLKEHTLSAAK